MDVRWKEFKETLTDVTSMSKKEFLLTMAVCVLGGIVFGMLFSPRKSTVIGSHNGNGYEKDGKKRKKSKKKSGVVDWEEVEQKEL